MKLNKTNTSFLIKVGGTQNFLTKGHHPCQFSTNKQRNTHCTNSQTYAIYNIILFIKFCHIVFTEGLNFAHTYFAFKRTSGSNFPPNSYLTHFAISLPTSVHSHIYYCHPNYLILHSETVLKNQLIGIPVTLIIVVDLVTLNRTTAAKAGENEVLRF